MKRFRRIYVGYLSRRDLRDMLFETQASYTTEAALHSQTRRRAEWWKGQATSWQDEAVRLRHVNSILWAVMVGVVMLGAFAWTVLVVAWCVGG